MKGKQQKNLLFPLFCFEKGTDDASWSTPELGFTLSVYKQVLLNDRVPIVLDRDSGLTVQANLCRSPDNRDYAGRGVYQCQQDLSKSFFLDTQYTS